MSYGELDGWAKQMQECSSVDLEDQEFYDQAIAEIWGVQDLRVLHFLHRHNLWDQLLAEDAQGKRRAGRLRGGTHY